MNKLITCVALILISCAAPNKINEPLSEDERFKKHKCLRDKKIAEDSGSGLVIKCDD